MFPLEDLYKPVVSVNEFHWLRLTGTTEHEPWNEYQLENGVRLRLKTVAQRILKIEGTDDYMVQSSNIVAVDVTEPEGDS